MTSRAVGAVPQTAVFACTISMGCRVKLWKGFSRLELAYFGVELCDSEVLTRREQATTNCSEQWS